MWFSLSAVIFVLGALTWLFLWGRSARLLIKSEHDWRFKDDEQLKLLSDFMRDGELESPLTAEESEIIWPRMRG